MPPITGRNWRAPAVLAILAIVAVGGCSGQRPVHAIRADADWYLARGDYEAAAGEYRAIVDRYAGDWQAQQKLGECYLVLDRPGDARRSLEIAYSLRPDNQQIVESLAQAIYRQEDFDALHAFLRAQADTTQSVEAYRRLARYALAMGDADSARIALETAIVIDRGRSVEPYLDAASFAERIGDLDLAVRRLRQAYGIQPGDERVRERLVAMGEIPGPTLALPPGR